MQIIGHKLKKQFVLFKRQGQVGQDGEWKIQPFSIPENAIREFMKLYKAKTGNEWTALPEFRRCTKKSALVPFDLMNRIQAADLEFDLETDSPSKLSPELQTIFLEFTNVNHLKEIVKKSILGLHLTYCHWSVYCRTFCSHYQQALYSSRLPWLFRQYLNETD